MIQSESKAPAWFTVLLTAATSIQIQTDLDGIRTLGSIDFIRISIEVGRTGLHRSVLLHMLSAVEAHEHDLYCIHRRNESIDLVYCFHGRNENILFFHCFNVKNKNKWK